jgi:hypothetical protein
MAVVPPETFGPYIGVRPEATLAVWAAQASGKRRWTTVPLLQEGAAQLEPKMVADAPAEIDLVALRPIGSGESAGFIVVSSAREFSGARIDALSLGLRGELAGGPTPLATSLGDVIWVDAVPTTAGAIALWAVRRADRADLFGVEIAPSGALRDQPARLVADARAWQVAKVPGGAAIAVVMAGEEHGAGGPLRVMYVDAEGHAEKKSVVVSSGTTAEPDVDMTEVGDRLVVVWSDRRDGDPRLYGATIDGAANVTRGAAPLGPPFGPQAVLRLVPPVEGGNDAYLAWENFVERRPGARTIRMARVSADGSLAEPEGALYMSGDAGIPELSASKKGVAAVTLAPACRRGSVCESSRGVPTFVELDPAMQVVTSMPVELDGHEADLVWGLACAADCTVLAAGASSPAPVYALHPRDGAGEWQPAAYRPADAPTPRAVRIEAVGASDVPAGLAATRVQGATAVAWVTYFDPATPFVRSKTPAPDGKYEAPRAALRLSVSPDGKAPPEPLVLSYRASSAGGVALSPGDPATGEMLLGWTGIDDQRAQVFLTLTDASGKKISQKMLTHGKDGISDVAVARVDDGWVVAWIAEHAGVAEVRVAKVDRSLRPVVPERRVGKPSSGATGVEITARGDHVIVAWSDARGSSEGVSDVYVGRLLAKDLTMVGPERPVVETRDHSRSPVMSPFAAGAVVAWIEDPAPGTEQSEASVLLAELDSGGEPVPGSVMRISPRGAPEAVGLLCGGDECHLAVTISNGTGGGVEAFVWRPGEEPASRQVVALEGRPTNAVSPVVIDGDIVYSDDQGARGAVIRRATIDWMPGRARPPGQ